MARTHHVWASFRSFEWVSSFIDSLSVSASSWRWSGKTCSLNSSSMRSSSGVHRFFKRAACIPCHRALLLLVLEVVGHDPVWQLVVSSLCFDVDTTCTTPVVLHFGGHLVRLSSYRFQLIS